MRCNCGYLFSPGATPVLPASEPGRFDFTGDGATLLVLYLKLIFFSIFTLGIYSFWGRAAVRQYLWSQIRLAGQPFAFHGTGKELLLGWLKLMGLVILFYGSAGLALVLLGERKAGGVIGLVFILGFALLAPLALHGAIRYRWSRTSWQGRRFAYRGDFWKLTTIVWTGLFLTAISLSLYLPVFITNLRKYVVENTWFGGQQFEFSGEGKDLLWPYVKMLLLFFPTLTLYRFWYAAKLGNFNWQNTKFAGVPFRSTLSGDGLLILTFTNLILTFFTLGIGLPWAVCRQLRYLTENLQLEQLPRVQLLAQAATAASAFGDTLGEALGTDAGIDAGFGL
ncbi:MAG: DUF898 family protein [Acidobacteria bacterium]|nr:DUF898 family protein [Acidobacteriota bacterium]